MELLEALEDLEGFWRSIAIDPAVTSNPGCRGEDSPIAVLA